MCFCLNLLLTSRLLSVATAVYIHTHVYIFPYSPFNGVMQWFSG